MKRHRSAQLTEREIRTRNERRAQHIQHLIDLAERFCPLGIASDDGAVTYRVPCHEHEGGPMAQAVVQYRYGRPVRVCLSCPKCWLLAGAIECWAQKFNLENPS